MSSVRTHVIPKIGFLAVVAVGVSLLASCSSSKSDLLSVRQFHLKDVDPAHQNAKMVRGEQLFRLRGAVTMEERKGRLGQYYTVSWKNDHARQGVMKVVMDYQQSATGSKILRMHRELPAGESSGKVEFKVSGESYRVGGRVLAWRIRLLRGKEVVDEKRSYLWR